MSKRDLAEQPVHWALWLTVLFFCVVALASCGSLDQVYLQADRATYDSLAPWVRAKADPVADESKLLVLDSWEARLVEAERSR